MGLKDNSLGAEFGFAAGTAKVGGGANVFGAHIGAEAEARFGPKIGLRIGQKTKIDVGPFSFSISFGKAKGGGPTQKWLNLKEEYERRTLRQAYYSIAPRESPIICDYQ